MLVVCHGNICRSPLAGAVLARILGQERVRDCGLKTRPGQICAKKIREFAEQAGYNLSEHRSQQVSTADVAWADVILFMDGGNYRRLQQLVGAAAKAQCLASYVGLERLADPAYVSRGPRLNDLLMQVVRAAEQAGRKLC